MGLQKIIEQIETLSPARSGGRRGGGGGRRAGSCGTSFGALIDSTKALAIRSGPALVLELMVVSRERVSPGILEEEELSIGGRRVTVAGDDGLDRLFLIQSTTDLGPRGLRELAVLSVYIPGDPGHASRVRARLLMVVPRGRGFGGRATWLLSRTFGRAVAVAAGAALDHRDAHVVRKRILKRSARVRGSTTSSPDCGSSKKGTEGAPFPILLLRLRLSTGAGSEDVRRARRDRGPGPLPLVAR